MPTLNQQFAIVDADGKIAAIVLTRGTEFHIYEQLEEAPRNFKEALKIYPGAKIVELELKIVPAAVNAGLV